LEVIRITDGFEEESAPPLCYVGTVGVRVLGSFADDRLEARLMRFAAGSRSRPHVCRSARVLHVVTGEAVVADSENRIVVGRGDTISVPAGEWHWHGGLPHVAAVLLVIERPADVSWRVAAGDWAQGYDVEGRET
jgi:quercetin dioxygenase-like cupin family protein